MAISFYKRNREENEEEIIDRKFGEWLREKRKATGLNLKTIALLAEFQTSRWLQLEGGNFKISIRPHEARGIAAALDIPVEVVNKKACGE